MLRDNNSDRVLDSDKNCDFYKIVNVNDNISDIDLQVISTIKDIASKHALSFLKIHLYLLHAAFTSQPQFF